MEAALLFACVNEAMEKKQSNFAVVSPSEFSMVKASTSKGTKGIMEKDVVNTVIIEGNGIVDKNADAALDL